METRLSVDIEVEVQIAAQFSELLSEDRLRRVAEATLALERATGQVTLVITDDEGIQALQRDFLGIDAPTDVLAFSAREGGEPFVVAPEAESYLGDIIISYPRAREQAEELGHAVDDELRLLIVHGLLHLLGYDHGEGEERAMMWARQEQILSML
jgi:probable rRNA maturation factor